MKDRFVLTCLAAMLGIAPAAPQHFQVDTDFGNAGVLYQQEPAWCTSTAPRKIITQPDGKLVSLFMVDASAAMVRRHLPDGSPDPTFATAGVLEIRIPGMNVNLPGLLVRPDGKVILTGVGHVTGEPPRILLVRVNADGTLDTSFGGDGYIQYSVSTWHTQYAAALQPDGKFLLAGSIASSFMVYRFLPNGDPDPSFGNNGLAYYTLPGESTTARCIRLDATGAIYLGGYRAFDLDATAQVVMKLAPNGMLDPSFGENGQVVIDHVPDVEVGSNKSEAMSDLFINADGSVITAGYVALPGTWEQFAIHRLAPDGTRDMNFGNNGALFVNVDPTLRDILTQLHQDGTGQFIATGYHLVQGGHSRIMMVRFGPQGQLVDSGDHNGAFLFQTNVLSGYNNSCTLDLEGRIIVANGYSIQPTGKSSLMAFTYQPALAVQQTSEPADAAVLWPNPTNGTASLRYSNEHTGPVSVEVLDLRGRPVAQLIGCEQRGAGDQLEQLSIPSSVASGTYHVRLVNDGGAVILPLSIQR